MKDLVKRILISIVSGLLLGYIVFLWMSNTVIVTSEYLRFNFFYFIGLIVVGLFLFVMFGVYPIHIKLTKPTLFAIGILMIVGGHYFLINDQKTSVFVGDIVKVFGVVLTLLSWTNVLITDKVKKQKEDSNMQVIEV